MMKYIIVIAIFILLTACGRFKGPKGDTGDPGKSCTTTTELDGTYITCPDGSTSFIPNPQDGINGSNGSDGKDGQSGSNGYSCTTESVDNGAIITCEDGSTSIILNGRDGKDSVVEIIDPCGDYLNEFDEILMKLSDGTIIAYFEDKNERFLSEIGPGSYQTTDGQKCNFIIDESNNISY